MRVTLKGSLLKEFDELHRKEVERKKKEAVEALAAATPVDTGEASRGWEYDDKGIYNNVDHIVGLNRGSSLQAPLNFVETTVMQIRGIEPNGIIVRET